MMKNRCQRPEILSEELSIVLIGDLNPKIFQPAWFAGQKLIRDSEAEAAKIELVHSDFTSFSTDWFSLQVSRDRFTAIVKSTAYKDHLRDLVLSTFHNLSHTPITQMGINYSVRLRFKNEADWHCFGHFLVPKVSWGDLLESPGMRSVAVEGKRPDKLPGLIMVIANPELNSPFEVSLRVNDHCDKPSDEKNLGASFFLQVIEEHYDSIMNRSKVLLDNLVDHYQKQEDFDDGSKD